MHEPIEINDNLFVAGQPAPQDLEELAKRGFRSVVNLRQAGEADDQLDPADEEAMARDLGMQYAHVPVSADEVSSGRVDHFREVLDQLPRPALVHCASGKRSGAFAMMHTGVESEMEGDEVLDRAEAMGFECSDDKLEDFVRRYIDVHVGGPS